MRKFYALAALVLGLASCQQDVDTVAPVGGEVDFQLKVAAPELAQTRGLDGDEQYDYDSAYGAIDYFKDSDDEYRRDWNEVNLRYTLEVYDKADKYDTAVPVKDRQVIIVDKYEPVVFDLRLIPNRDYHFVVFADFVPQNVTDATQSTAIALQENLGISHTIGETLADIKLVNHGLNDERTDAYFAAEDITITNSAAQDIVLKRPYGKVRVIATDLHELNLNVNPKAVKVEYTAPQLTNFNAVTGVATVDDANTKVVFDSEYNAIYKEVDKGGLQNHFYTTGYDALEGHKYTTADGKERHTHMTLFTDYILANATEQEVIHFTMTVYEEYDHQAEDGRAIKSTTFTTDIPVERNKLTTVIGNVLTTATEIEVRIDDNFAGENVENLWDGKAKEPKKDAQGNWIIEEASELAWLADQVNGTTRATGRTFEGETFKLTKDIDLNGELWTPIGATGTTFMGTFDGQNHKITNLFVSVDDKTPVGLFARARNVKNVKVIGAEIYGHYKAGVIVGDGLCARIENCHVEDAIVKIVPLNKDDANHAGGIVGYISAEPTAYVKNCSVKNAEISAFRDVAGIAGTTNNSGNGTVVVSGCTVENVTITADQTVEYVSNEKDGNAAAVAGRLGSNAQIADDNTVADDVVVIRKVDSTKEMEYAVADAQNGETIYVGNGEVALPHFESKALNFVGIHENAAIAEPVSGHIDAFWQGAELNFTDLKIKATSYTGKANGYVKSAKEAYTNCKFVDGYYMFAGDVVTVDNCVFTGKYNSYFWTGSADEITFNKCKFNAVERAVKVCTVGHTGVERKVNFNECEFTATEQKKAALEIDGSKGSSYIVRIDNCTETGFAKGEFTDMTMFNVEGAENVQVYLDGKKWVRNGVMEENDELFAYNAAGLQYLLDNAVNGETVKIGADIEGDVTVSQKADVKITIEGNDHKYAGVITVDGKSATYTTAGVTIKNLNFEAETISADACIRLGDGTNPTRYACNVAVEGCTFNVPGAVAVKSYTGGDKNLTIKDCTATGIHSLLQVKNVEGITIEGVNITGGRGASFGVSSNIVVKNSTFVAESYGLRVDATAEATLAIENVNITAKLPVIARKTSKNYTINFTGENTLVAGGYQVVFTTGDDEAAFVAPAEYTLTGADSFKVFPRDAATYNYVYSDDELQAAINAGWTSIVLQPGKYEKTINLKSDVTIEGLPGAVANCFNLNGADNVTLKNIEFDAAGADMSYDGKGTGKQYANITSGGASKNGSGTRGLVIEGCTFAGAFANGGVAIAFVDQGRGSGQSGDVTIKGCTFATTNAYYDIYCHYSGYGYLNIEGNTFKSEVLGLPIYLGRYQSSTPVVVKDNTFEKYADFSEAAYIQAHSTAYTVSFDASNNTFAN